MTRYLLTVLAGLMLARGAAQVELQFWTISLAPTFNRYIEETLEQFNAANPELRVRWRDLSMEAIGYELLNAITAGEAPDVVNINVPMLLGYAERGLMQDLSQPLGERQALYFENMLESFRVGGELLAMPWYSAPPVLLYNQALFEQAGLNPDAPPQSTRELEQTATALQDRTGYYGYMPNLISQQMLYRFLEEGLPVLSDDGFEAVFASPEHADFLAQQIELFQQGYIHEDALLRGHMGAVELYGTGHLGMLLTGPQFLTRLRDNYPSVYATTRVAPYPLGAGEVVHAPLMGLAIPRMSRYPAEALELALFVTNAERQLAFSRLTTIFPSVIEAADDPFFTELPDAPTLEDEARHVGAGQLQYAADFTMHLPNANNLFRTFQKNLEAAFFGFKTPREALEAALRFWNSRL